MHAAPFASALVAWACACAVALLTAPVARADEAPPTVNECLASSQRGQTDRDEGRVVRAREAFVTCASAACPSAVRGACVKWLDEVDASLPSVVFVVRDGAGKDLGDVVVRVDGAVIASSLDGKAVAVDPGDHLFTFERGPLRAEGRAIVHAAERNRVMRVRLSDEGSGILGADTTAEVPPAAHRVPVGSAILGGVSAAFAVSALVLWSAARSDLTSLEASPCAATRTCAPGDVQSVKTRLLVGDVLMGAGAAALGVAVWIWVADRPVAVDVRASQLRLTAFF